MQNDVNTKRRANPCKYSKRVCISLGDMRMYYWQPSELSSDKDPYSRPRVYELTYFIILCFTDLSYSLLVFDSDFLIYH